jgi:hypothetical protein
MSRLIHPSSSPWRAGQDWLAAHDPSYRQHISPRLQRFQKRRHERRKAGQQRRMQERGYLATPVLKGV